jgi:hypothetical protein
MIGLESLRWLLTVAFGGAAVFHLLRCVRPSAAGPARVVGTRISELLHLLMGVSMIAMVWPWGEAVPRAAWILVFTVSTGWFVVRTASAARRRLVPAFFATVMAAMVWMGASTPARASAGDPHHGVAMATTGHTAAGYPGWISAGLGGYLVLAALWWVIRGSGIGVLSPATAVAAARPLNWSALCHGVMSAGMGLALLAML